MDLFDFIHELNTLPLCRHTGVTVKHGGWTKEHDPNSPYHGCYVHGDPDCRMPKHLKELIAK